MSLPEPPIEPTQPLPERLTPDGILSGMNEPALLQLATFGTFFKKKVGEQLITEGQTQDRFYILIRGRLKISVRVAGSPTVVAHAEAGECLGEATVLCPGPATASVKVEKKAILWSMDATELRNYISEHAGGGGALLMGMAQCLSQRMRKANAEIIKHHLKPPTIMRVGQMQAITAASLPQIQDPGFFSKLKSSMAREKKVKISTEIKM